MRQEVKLQVEPLFVSPFKDKVLTQTMGKGTKVEAQQQQSMTEGIRQYRNKQKSRKHETQDIKAS